jgi:hypothetical protein
MGLCAKSPCLLLPQDRSRRRSWRTGRRRRRRLERLQARPRWGKRSGDGDESMGVLTSGGEGQQGGRRRTSMAAVVLWCISGDGERRNGFISARGCLRRPRFAPVGLQAGESGRRTRPPPAAPCANNAGRRRDAARRGEARCGARRPLTVRFIGDAAWESGARAHARVGWPAAACPPWTPLADGLRRASDGPCAGRRLGDGLGRAHGSAQSGRIGFFFEIHFQYIGIPEKLQ